MSEFKSSSFRNEDNSGAPDIVGVTSFTSPFYFVPPSGTTAQRPSGDGLAPGMLRFNTDIGRLEVWRGDHWGIILGESPNLGISTAAAPASSGTGARGVFGGGANPTNSTVIDYISISSLGNAIKFGDLSAARRSACAASSNTRGVFGFGADVPSTGTKIDFITFSSTGNATDFSANFGTARRNGAGCSNSTRGLFGGGNNDSSPIVHFNIIDYITIASTGIISDFGDLTQTLDGPMACSSSTRGVFATGGVSAPSITNQTNRIDYVTISTCGNAVRFGDLTTSRVYGAGCSNSIRGLFGGGGASPGTNTVEFVTIASTGNAQDFGDLTRLTTLVGSCSSTIRGVWAGDATGAGTSNIIDYVTIATTGNAADFGDLTDTRAQPTAGCSNAHGGL